jgi:hypothetical protein
MTSAVTERRPDPLSSDFPRLLSAAVSFLCAPAGSLSRRPAI